ncbi:MAG: hypothetical protein DI535_19580 [Citrobacter freundii]|nr:MAG: hypothetical protein DI535_19580 [Citrobacter freundii]
MNIIELEIFPSFNPSCCIRLIEQTSSYDLSIQINDVNKSRWQVTVFDISAVGMIESLASKVVAEAAADERMMLDGVGLKCMITENEISRQHEFRNPVFGSDEFELVNHFLAVVQQCISDQSLINYIELIEGYFSDTAPVKIFNERPLRLRIYGLLSVSEREELISIIDRVKNDDDLVIDMTNFVSMGTILYECFSPLKHVSNLTFLANENALKRIVEMGFDKNTIQLVS